MAKRRKRKAKRKALIKHSKADLFELIATLALRIEKIEQEIWPDDRDLQAQSKTPPPASQ